MRRALPLLLAVMALLAGCFGEDGEGKVEASDADGPDERKADVLEGDVESMDATPTTATIPVVLDGNIGSSAVVCVLGPVGQCAFVPVEEGTSGALFEGFAGWIDGGELTLTWDAGSPATEKLTAGFMLMDGGEGCDGLELAGAQGASPLTLTVAAAPRALCAGEVVHLWVAGTTFGAQDPAYYQVDLDQAFHVEGAFLLRPLAVD